MSAAGRADRSRSISPTSRPNRRTGSRSSTASRTPSAAVSIPPDLATCDDCVAEIFDRGESPVSLRVHELHELRAAFHDRHRHSLRPRARRRWRRSRCARPAGANTRTSPIGDSTRSRTRVRSAVRSSTLRAPDGARIHADDVIAVAARAIGDGLIVAVKGIGGFHLACDATSERRRPRVARSASAATRSRWRSWCGRCATPRALGFVGADERRLLTSVERPIVLAREASRRAGSRTRWRRDNPMVGVFLPYSPLHHLLLADARRPLVMTSGNVSDEPIACDNDEAHAAPRRDRRPLRPARPRHRRRAATIRWRAMIAGTPTVLRRGARLRPARRCRWRAASPAGARLRRAAEEHVLHRRRHECLARSAHRRSREPARRSIAYTRTRSRGWSDSSTCARRSSRTICIPTICRPHTRAARPALETIAVQHHHAHVVSAMAEHGIDGPGDRHRLRRHGLRHRRHDRGAAKCSSRRRVVPSAPRRSDRCRSPAATARSGSRGGSRSRW